MSDFYEDGPCFQTIRFLWLWLNEAVLTNFNFAALGDLFSNIHKEILNTLLEICVKAVYKSMQTFDSNCRERK